MKVNKKRILECILKKMEEKNEKIESRNNTIEMIEILIEILKNTEEISEKIEKILFTKILSCEKNNFFEENLFEIFSSETTKFFFQRASLYVSSLSENFAEIFVKIILKKNFEKNFVAQKNWKYNFCNFCSSSIFRNYFMKVLVDICKQEDSQIFKEKLFQFFTSENTIRKKLFIYFSNLFILIKKKEFGEEKYEIYVKNILFESCYLMELLVNNVIEKNCEIEEMEDIIWDYSNFVCNNKTLMKEEEIKTAKNFVFKFLLFMEKEKKLNKEKVAQDQLVYFDKPHQEEEEMVLKKLNVCSIFCEISEKIANERDDHPCLYICGFNVIREMVKQKKDLPLSFFTVLRCKWIQILKKEFQEFRLNFWNDFVEEINAVLYHLRFSSSPLVLLSSLRAFGLIFEFCHDEKTFECIEKILPKKTLQFLLQCLLYHPSKTISQLSQKIFQKFSKN